MFCHKWPFNLSFSSLRFFLSFRVIIILNLTRFHFYFIFIFWVSSQNLNGINSAYWTYFCISNCIYIAKTMTPASPEYLWFTSTGSICSDPVSDGPQRRTINHWNWQSLFMALNIWNIFIMSIMRLFIFFGVAFATFHRDRCHCLLFLRNVL